MLKIATKFGYCPMKIIVQAQFPSLKRTFDKKKKKISGKLLSPVSGWHFEWSRIHNFLCSIPFLNFEMEKIDLKRIKVNKKKWIGSELMDMGTSVDRWNRNECKLHAEKLKQLSKTMASIWCLEGSCRKGREVIIKIIKVGLDRGSREAGRVDFRPLLTFAMPVPMPMPAEPPVEFITFDNYALICT